jgi:hypothetical protein
MGAHKLNICDYKLQRAYTLAAHEFRVKFPEKPQPIILNASFDFFEIGFKDSNGELTENVHLFFVFSALIKVNFNGLIKWGGDSINEPNPAHFTI